MLHPSSLKKAFCFIAFCFGLFQINGLAQFYNNGGIISVTTGGVLYADMEINNVSTGSITNEGDITTTKSFITDPAASLSGNGTYHVQGNFMNKGTYNAGTSVLEMYGNKNSKLKNETGEIYQLIVNKSANKNVILQGPDKILNKVTFTTNKNYIKLGNYVLTLDDNCIVDGFSNYRYFITDGDGFLKKLNVSSTGFTFPVGFDKYTYNPITLTENGTADDYSVRCLEHALLQGSTGSPISNGGIDAGWYVEQANSGGANVDILAQWKSSDELTGFDKTHCEVVRYKNTAWDYDISKEAAAAGGLFRTVSTSGFSNFGYITVLSTATPTFGNTFSPVNKSANNINAAQIKVYPTLVQNFVNVDILQNTKNIQKMNITISDGAGKVVWQKQDVDFQSQHLTLPYLAQGVYFVNVYFGTEKFVQKIVVGR